MKIKKRGDVPSLWALIELAAAIFVGILLASVGASLAKGTIYEKLNLAKDLAMQIDTLYGVPGDSYLINNNLHGYSVHFLDNKIEVFDDDSDQSKGVHYFVKKENLKLDLKLNKPKQVVISKIGEDIKISEEIPSLI